MLGVGCWCKTISSPAPNTRHPFSYFVRKGTIPTSKRRGLSRATWPMRLAPPKVPTAATAAFGATVGPRVMPGVYTVKMTKDKQVYTTELRVAPDPRSKHTEADRRAQFDLAMKLHAQLGEMTCAVERINALRLGLDERAARLPAGDALARELADVVREFDQWATAELPAINSALTARGLEPLRPLTREEWEQEGREP